MTSPTNCCIISVACKRALKTPFSTLICAKAVASLVKVSAAALMRLGNWSDMMSYELVERGKASKEGLLFWLAEISGLLSNFWRPILEHRDKTEVVKCGGKNVRMSRQGDIRHEE